METGQGYELELVAHVASSRWNPAMSASFKLLLPVERRRAVVGQQLAREFAHGWLRRTAGPPRGSVRMFRTRSRRHKARKPNRARWPTPCRRCTRKKPSSVRSPVMKGWSRGSISLVSSVAALASVRAMSTVGTPRRRRPVGRQPASLSPPRGYQHLAAQVAALLGRGELVFEMHAAAPASIIAFMSSKAFERARRNRPRRRR